MLKEQLSSVLDYDAPLARSQNYHLREFINDHEDIVITMLG